jgi:hypothetical protein
MDDIKVTQRAINQALKLPQGQKVKNHTATLKDWLIVILASELYQGLYDLKEKENATSRRI